MLFLILWVLCIHYMIIKFICKYVDFIIFILLFFSYWKGWLPPHLFPYLRTCDLYVKRLPPHFPSLPMNAQLPRITFVVDIIIEEFLWCLVSNIYYIKYLLNWFWYNDYQLFFVCNFSTDNVPQLKFSKITDHLDNICQDQGQWRSFPKLHFTIFINPSEYFSLSRRIFKKFISESSLYPNSLDNFNYYEFEYTFKHEIFSFCNFKKILS